MAFSRNSLAAAVAGTLSLAVLTGCPAQPPAGVGTPTAAPTTGTPTAAPTAPGATAAPTTSPDGSVAPSVQPSPSKLEATTLRGKVYDLDRAVVNTGGKVTVKSLNASNPFESTVDVISGSYVVNGVPAGVQLEITASRTGWTSRTRVETLLPLTSTQANIVNFGSATATAGEGEDPEGQAYFISKFPEVSSVTPADETENVDPTKLTVVLTLSEPLDTSNQRRFANAIRVLPANSAAAPLATAAPDLTEANDEATVVAGVDTAFGTGVGRYFVKEGSIFLDDDATRATVTWDAAGQVATLTFNAPLIADDNNNARYAVALVAQSDDIEDAEGNELGYAVDTANGNTAGFGGNATGNLIENAFRERDLSLANETNAAGASAAPANAWVATHQNFTTFEVAEDDTDPQLTGVSVSEVGTETRINLTFSEPMAAFNGTSVGYFDNSLRFATSYSFAVAEEAADLADVDLEGDLTLVTTGAGQNVVAAADIVGANVGAEDASGDVDQEVEFQIGTAAYTSTTTDPIYVEVSPTDPKTVRLVLNTTTFFSDDVNAIKARVEGVADPAGNAITETQADAQIKTGNI